MKVIIAEKPQAGADIAKAIGNPKWYDGYCESGGYIVTWAAGHLFGLSEPEAYHARYKYWKIEDLPIIPEKFLYTLLVNTPAKSKNGNSRGMDKRKQFRIIAELVKKATLVINAGDAGREGETIIRLILRQAKYNGPVKRLWLKSLTKKAILEGMKQLRPSQEFDSLFEAGECRSKADWLIGMNSTRALTVKNSEVYHVGRVQTPTLAMVVRRELEILNFKANTYYEVEATFKSRSGSYTGLWMHKPDNRTETLTEAEDVVAKVQGKTGVISSVEENQEKEHPPDLFDLVGLEQECIKLFGLTAKQVDDVAQELYERYKVISYPRTDSTFITKDIVATISDRIRAVQSLQNTKAWLQPLKQNGIKLSSRFVNDAKVSDHHAILPTELAAQTLTGVHLQVYEVIAKRFIAAFYPSAEWTRTTVITSVNGEEFYTSGRTLIQPGWRRLYPTKESNIVMPQVLKGEQVSTHAMRLDKTTKPPPRYTEASLLKAMTNVGNKLSSEHRSILKDKGLGTPATRGPLLETLRKRGYLKILKTTLYPTEKAMKLITRFSIPELSSAELTAEWEKRLLNIETKNESSIDFMKDIKQFTKILVKKIATR